MKKQEELLMLQALGLKPPQQTLSSGKTMEQHEIDELCKRGNIAEEERDIHFIHSFSFSILFPPLSFAFLKPWSNMRSTTNPKTPQTHEFPANSC
jgi:hypothetical protein